MKIGENCANQQQYINVKRIIDQELLDEISFSHSNPMIIKVYEKRNRESFEIKHYSYMKNKKIQLEN